MQPNPQETSDLVAFSEEIHNGKLHFLWSGYFVSITGQVCLNTHISAGHKGLMCHISIGRCYETKLWPDCEDLMGRIRCFGGTVL